MSNNLETGKHLHKWGPRRSSGFWFYSDEIESVCLKMKAIVLMFCVFFVSSVCVCVYFRVLERYLLAWGLL